MKKRKAYIVGIILMIFIGFFLFFQNQNKIVETSGYKIGNSEYKEIISSIGVIEYGSTVAVKTEVTGTLLQINKDVGDRISSGDILAKIDNSKALLEYNAAVNNRLLAKSRYEDYIKNYNENVESIKDEKLLQEKEIEALNLQKDQLDSKISTTEKLVKEGAIPEKNLTNLKEEMDLLKLKLDKAKTRLNTLKVPTPVVEEMKANIKAADENINKQEINLEKYSITSPIEGIVINKNIEEGSFVQPGETILEISSDKEKYAVVEIDEKYISKIVKGKEAEIYIKSYPEEKIKGVVDKITPEVDKDAGTIKVEVKILEKPELFLQNMTVRVEFVGDSYDNTIVIPGKYIIENETAVYIKDKDGFVAKKNITVYSKNNENVRITEGLKEGDIILNPENLKEGITVKINLYEESENVL